jgi:hypothetical protein
MDDKLLAASMNDNVKHGLGHIQLHDPRDALYPLSAILPPKPFTTNKMWWDNGWWGDQGNTSMCTAFAWSHWLEDGPMIQDELANQEKPLYDPTTFYKKEQLNDGIPGNNYNGSTVRAGAKILKGLNVINEYRWAQTLDDITTCLLTLGPVVVGTTWYTDMFNPDGNGLIHVAGGIAGGHAYVLNGVDTEKQLFRIKNSWGRGWGQNGHAFISFDDFNKLFTSGGQVCMAIANKLTALPALTSFPDSDVA